MQNDRESLAEYVRSGAESAFAQIVDANVGMVYSVCCRILRDEHLAQDATQAVFFLLARKAKSLHRDVVIAGWLHAAARNVCSNLRRSELIRRRHEMKAAHEHEASAVVDDSVFDPALIDQALGSLRDAERDPILLRFFQGMTFAQVGQVLRISEDAAKKRTERALDRLRELLRPAGGTAMSAAGLGAVLGSCSHTTPPALASAATAAAIHGAVPKTLALALKGAIGMSATTKTQVGIAAVITMILLGTGAVLMTMSLDEKKTQSVIATPTPAAQQDPPPQMTAGAQVLLPAQLPKIPDWVPGGNTPMLMPRRPGERRGLFFTIQAEHFDSKKGGKMVAPGMSELAGGDWLCYERVDLDQGANRFAANIAAAEVDPTSAIEVRLDSPTATPIATLKVQKTPDWSVHVTQSAPIEAATGVHDVYLTFNGPARVADVNWFKFVRIPREATSQISGNSYDDAHGVNDHDGVIANIDRGDFLKYSQLDFGQGLENFEACIGVGDRYSNGQPANTRGQIEIRLDAVDGPVIGLLITQSTGTFTTHVPQSTPISKTSGIHDVYLTFRTNAVCDLEWLTFK